MTTGIYAFENKINGKKYIGQAVNLERRLREHEYYLELGRDKCAALQRAVNKYGRENFSVYVIEYCEPEVLNALEIHYIKLYDSASRNGYNVSAGGMSGLLGYKHPPEVGRKISAAKKGWKMSEEAKKKISHFNSGKVVSPETRAKISAGRSGEKHYFWGKKYTEEEKAKLSKAHSGANAWQLGLKTKNSTSQYYGVYRTVQKKKHVYYIAQANVNGKKIYLGIRKIESEAARLYDAYVIENGLPNPLNFPQQGE